MADDMDIDDSNSVNAEEAQQIADQKIINEEYKLWKKHAPMLYDVLFSKALEWPTLTTQWLPDMREPKEDPLHSFHRLIYGTNTGNDSKDYINIAELKVPKIVSDPKSYNPEKGELGGHGAGKSQGELKFEVTQRILHPGEVNKARYMWQNPEIIASLTSDGRCLIWDRTKLPSAPTDKITPQIELISSDVEGFALHWNPRIKGQLATGSNDGIVKLWDITSYTASKNGTAKLSPVRSFTEHTAAVNDIEFNPAISNLLASVSDDHSLKIFDTRQGKPGVYKEVKEAHKSEVTCVAWNPARAVLLATGSEDKSIALWDLRNLNMAINTLEGHRAPVSKLQWHPHSNLHHILASSSKDRRINFWDLSQTGKEQTPEDAEDGPPELLFMHGGHTNYIADFDFNKNIPWLTFSAADDNLVQIWRTTQTLVGGQDEGISTAELERRPRATTPKATTSTMTTAEAAAAAQQNHPMADAENKISAEQNGNGNGNGNGEGKETGEEGVSNGNEDTTTSETTKNFRPGHVKKKSFAHQVNIDQINVLSNRSRSGSNRQH